MIHVSASDGRDGVRAVVQHERADMSGSMKPWESSPVCICKGSAGHRGSGVAYEVQPQRAILSGGHDGIRLVANVDHVDASFKLSQ